jgi:hypothetical protein
MQWRYWSRESALVLLAGGLVVLFGRRNAARE